MKNVVHIPNIAAHVKKTRRHRVARLGFAIALLAAGLLFGPAPKAWADGITYYFNACNGANPGAGDDSPDSVVDGSTSTAGTDNEDNDYLDLTANEGTGADLGTISAVEVRSYFTNNYDANPVRTVCPEFIPYFNGTDAGDVHTAGTGNYDGSAGYPQWGSYYDITTDANAPCNWTWSDVQNLDMRVQLNRLGGPSGRTAGILL